MNSLTTEAIGDRPAVAVGDELPGVAVEDSDGDVGAGLGGVGGGLCARSAEAGEGGRGLVGGGSGSGAMVPSGATTVSCGPAGSGACRRPWLRTRRPTVPRQ